MHIKRICVPGEKMATKEQTRVETVVQGVKEILTAENVDVLATKVLKRMQDSGVRKNIRGKQLTQDKVKAQIGRIFQDVKKGREGWWKTYELVNDNKVVGLKVKVTAQ